MKVFFSSAVIQISAFIVEGAPTFSSEGSGGEKCDFSRKKKHDQRRLYKGSCSSYLFSTMLYLVYYLTVTGVNIHVITPCVCLICIFYTCVGGLKAVVWTDVVQSWLMVAGILLMIIKGTIDVGGFGVVWNRSWESGRLETPGFEFDLTIRNSIWSVTIGGLGNWLQGGILNQNMIQRYMSLPTIAKARWALLIFIIGGILFVLSCSYIGLLIYATYHDCDPVATKLAKAKDQLFPLLVMQVLGDYPGLPGIFVAAIFSASLSSLSTGLNSMAAVVLEDFIKPFTSKKISEQKTMIIMKSVVVIFGVICVALVFVVEKMGAVLPLTISLGAIASGPCLGIFCCGMILPWINAKGTFYGSLVGLFGSGLIIIKSQNLLSSGVLQFPMKPTSTDGCDYFHNGTLPSANLLNVPDEYVFPLFKLSYLFYAPFGALVTITAIILISVFTGFQDVREVDPMYLSPVLRRFLPVREKNHIRGKEEQELMLIYCEDKKINFENAKEEKK